MLSKTMTLPTAEQALRGRTTTMPVAELHFVNHHPMAAPYPAPMQQAMFGMGCFWGAERCFWLLPGVYVTAVGYAAGITPNPTYEEVCSGRTGHNEVVLVIYDPTLVSYATLLKTFWLAHNPTQGMRQGNDIGTQYRSGIYTYNAQQLRAAEHSRKVTQGLLSAAGYADISTEIVSTESMAAPVFYYAEDYHQQYLAKNPHGYCGLGGLPIHLEESLFAE